MDRDGKIEFAIDLARKLSEDPELRNIVTHALKHTLLPWDDRPDNLGGVIRYSERINLVGEAEVKIIRANRVTTLDKANIDERCRENGYVLVGE